MIDEEVVTRVEKIAGREIDRKMVDRVMKVVHQFNNVSNKIATAVATLVTLRMNGEQVVWSRFAKETNVQSYTVYSTIISTLRNFYRHPLEEIDDEVILALASTLFNSDFKEAIEETSKLENVKSVKLTKKHKLILPAIIRSKDAAMRVDVALASIIGSIAVAKDIAIGLSKDGIIEFKGVRK